MKRTGLQASKHLFQKIVTMEVSKKSVLVGDKDVYDVHLIYSMSGGRIFYVGGQSGGKEKSILLNIKRVKKLEY